MRQRPPGIWAPLGFTAAGGLVLALLIGVIRMVSPPSPPDAAGVWQWYVRPPVGASPSPDALTDLSLRRSCLMLLPDGDLEFVTSCGCHGTPGPL